MKKILFLLYSAFLFIDTQAQAYSYFMFSGGITNQNINSKSFEKFKDNYTNFHSNNIKRTRNYPGQGFYIQANLSPIPLLNMEISRHNSHKQVIFNDGGSLDFKLSQRLFRFNMGFNVGNFEDEGFIIKPEFSMGFGNAIMQIDSKLTNTQDKDNRLAGEYKESSMVLSVGLNFIYKKDDSPFGFKAYIRQNWNPVPGKLKRELLVDYNYWRVTDPSDIWRYEGEYVKSDYRFLEIGIGACIIFSDLGLLD